MHKLGCFGRLARCNSEDVKFDGYMDDVCSASYEFDSYRTTNVVNTLKKWFKVLCVAAGQVDAWGFSV